MLKTLTERRRKIFDYICNQIEQMNEFTTDYAVSHPEEDIAESWTYFVFSKKPTGDWIVDQKILFFYEYPELIRLRSENLSNLLQMTEEF
ncbi:hypothetical protein [Domibacillus mangrovi]|uniref:Uncharacterized protein n=1 Tax=Domibacillus mangrovi TaxID=1714354 RepID=A0A1Q5NZP7_9BACI|nr:hypothetical protein [Domibacillus mangrovi]OKL35485.1 hypothetical protein BLL40_15110 [Domibacillus mangrovi]